MQNSNTSSAYKGSAYKSSAQKSAAYKEPANRESYDFAMFDGRSSAAQLRKRTQPRKRKPATSEQALQKRKREMERKRELARYRAKLYFVGAILLTALIMLIAVNIKNTEITGQLDKINDDYESLVEEHDAMMVEFERRMSDKAIEEYAIDLGMHRRESNLTHWVTVTRGDVFEIASNSSEASAFELWYDNLLTYFG